MDYQNTLTDFITVNGLQLKTINVPEYSGETFYLIDGIPTIIDVIKKNIAKCRVLSTHNDSFVNCYVVRYEDCYAHGSDLKQTFLDAQHKAFSKLNVIERIKQFVSKYPDPNIKILNSELFKLHNWLTGSCEFGRRMFVDKLGLTDGESSILDFIRLSKGNFGSEIIEQLEHTYLDNLNISPT